jgi:hypothetical protein
MSSIDAAEAAATLRFPQETVFSELGRPDPESWKNTVPLDLRPAVKAVRDLFEEKHERWAQMTSDLCHAQIHGGWTGNGTALLHDIERACANRAAKERFHRSLRQATLPGKFKATFNLYRDGLRESAEVTFNELLASGNIEWAKLQVTLLIRSQRREILAWFRQACDRREADWVGWEDWCAPRLLQMAWGTASFDAERLWEPLASQLSWTLVNSFVDACIEALIAKIGKVANKALSSGIALGVNQDSAPPSGTVGPTARRKGGRPPKQNKTLVLMAGRLWRENQSANRFVSDEALGRIAAELDKSPFRNPSEHLPKKAADDLNKHNMKFGNSLKKLLTWMDVVSKNVGQFYFKKVLRKWLSECARQSEK